MSNYDRSDKEPGFDSVRAKYGDKMVQRMRNWPTLTRVYEMAQGRPEDDTVMKDSIEAAERKVERAARDREYAVDQADMIVRSGLPADQWDVVPSVAQLQREYEQDAQRSRNYVRTWAKDNPDFGRGRKATEGETGA